MSNLTITLTNTLALAVAERERRRRQKIRTPDPYATDPYAFITECILIDNTQPDTDQALEAIPFALWDAQRDLLSDLQTNRLILILKARQLGISWLVCAYALWMCLYRPSRLVLFFSIGQDEANEMMRRVNVMYWRLTAERRANLPDLRKDNTEEMRWANGSAIQSLPSRKTSGSSYTASLVVLDELAKNPNAETIYTAVKPTIDGGGSMIVLSSANGAGNLFHELVTKARDNLGRFVFRFLPWYARPGRDAAWYQAVASDAIDDGHMKQEYPATPDEAFEATEVDTFLSSIVLWDACRDDLPPLIAHEPCVLVADAGESDDTFGVVLISQHPSDPKRIAIRHARAYVPNGQTLDHALIEADIRDLIKRYAVQELAYDPMLMGQMVLRIERDGIVKCVPFNQGTMRLEADKGLLDLTQTRVLAHDGNTQLRSHIENANRKVTADGKRLRIVKREHALKIDLAVATAMGCHRWYAESRVVSLPKPPAKVANRWKDY